MGWGFAFADKRDFATHDAREDLQLDATIVTLTLVVIASSSKYWQATPSCVRVDAQPRVAMSYDDCEDRAESPDEMHGTILQASAHEICAMITADCADRSMSRMCAHRSPMSVALRAARVDAAANTRYG
jgi:hypothetical protein